MIFMATVMAERPTITKATMPYQMTTTNATASHTAQVPNVDRPMTINVVGLMPENVGQCGGHGKSGQCGVHAIVGQCSGHANAGTPRPQRRHLGTIHVWSQRTSPTQTRTQTLRMEQPITADEPTDHRNAATGAGKLTNCGCEHNSGICLALYVTSVSAGHFAHCSPPRLNPVPQQ